MNGRGVIVLLAGLALPVGCGGGDGTAGGPEGVASAPQPVTGSRGGVAPPAPEVSQSDPLPETGTLWRHVTSNSGAWHVHWRPTVEPIPLNEPFGLQVAVTDAGTDETAPADLALSVDARMPDHRHGMLREPNILHVVNGGPWQVSGMLLHMPGYWEIHVDLTLGARTERAQIPIELD